MDTTSITETSNQTIGTLVNVLSSSQPLTILLALAILVFGFILVRLILKRVGQILEKNERLRSLQAMIQTVVRFVLDLIVILIAAQTLGVPVTSVLAVFSIIGLAISLAIQGLLTNLAAGISIIVSRPFVVGHFIEAGTLRGTVTEIRMMHTKLLSPEGQSVIIPNNTLSSSNLINYSANSVRRIDLSVSASYDFTPEAVKAAIRTAINRTPNILQEPAPDIHLDKYSESTIDYVLWVWVRNENFLVAKFALNENLYQAFKDHGVEMSYPHLNVHMVS